MQPLYIVQVLVADESTDVFGFSVEKATEANWFFAGLIALAAVAYFLEYILTIDT